MGAEDNSENQLIIFLFFEWMLSEVEGRPDICPRPIQYHCMDIHYIGSGF